MLVSGRVHPRKLTWIAGKSPFLRKEICNIFKWLNFFYILMLVFGDLFKTPMKWAYQWVTVFFHPEITGLWAHLVIKRKNTVSGDASRDLT